MTFEELQESVRILNGLLQDPHPDLCSWRILYSARMNEVARYWHQHERD